MGLDGYNGVYRQSDDDLAKEYEHLLEGEDGQDML